jgi:ketopantoate reductase
MELKTFPKDKKAQFYIMTAAILCIATFTALQNSNVQEVKSDTQFTGTVDNFISEAPYVINYAKYWDYNVTKTFENFEEDFKEYMANQNSKVSIIYLIKQRDSLFIKKNYNSTITIRQPLNYHEIEYNTYQIIELSEWVKIIIDNDEYEYTFNDDPIELKLLFIKNV